MNELTRQFPCQSKIGGLRCWTTRPLILTPRLCHILKTLNQPGGPGVEVLRAVKRHTVLRVQNIAEQPSWIVKGFPLGRLKSRWQYRKYGWTEALNWHRARTRGIPVPNYFGYFEWRPLALIKTNGVFMEDLREHRTLDQLLQGPGANRPALLQLAIPLLKLLYETGVNHADPSPHNMLFAPEARDPRLIDWEGCAFVKARQIEQLLLHASHFLNFAKVDSSSPEWRPWLNDLHSACACSIARPVLERAVATLQPRGRIRLAERLALHLDEATGAVLRESNS